MSGASAGRQDVASDKPFDARAWLKQQLDADYTFPQGVTVLIERAYAAGIDANGAQRCSYCGTSCVPNVIACKDCAAKYLIAGGEQVQQAGRPAGAVTERDGQEAGR